MDSGSGLRIDSQRIREAHEARIVAYGAEPRPLTVRSESRVVDNHFKEARVGPFTIESDEGAIVGGDGRAPTPLSYFVSSLGLAILTDLVRAFALRALPVEELRVEVVAEFPVEAKYGSDTDAPVAATRVSYTVDVVSAAPRADVDAAIAWAERFCHAVHTVRDPVAVESTYRVNGA